MANELFGNLGGLVRGLSGLMPQDDPNSRVFSLQMQLNDLHSEETELCAGVGRRVLAEEPDRFGESARALEDLRRKIAAVQTELSGAQQKKQQAEAEQRRAEELRTCPNCGSCNPEGTKYCQECGAKLGPLVCSGCGAELLPGTRFCGVCGKGAGDAGAREG